MHFVGRGLSELIHHDASFLESTFHAGRILVEINWFRVSVALETILCTLSLSQSYFQILLLVANFPIFTTLMR